MTVGERFRDGLAAGAFAAVFSGAPSTLHALATGRDALEPTRAAGSMLLPRASRPAKLVAAVPVHLALSLGWGVALAFALPRRRRVAWGAVAGAVIAALDLGLVAPRRFPRVAALPTAPQVADHVAFGALVGWILDRRAAQRSAA